MTDEEIKKYQYYILLKMNCARLLHYLEAQRTSIYHEPVNIDTAWASDEKNRGLWNEYALNVLQGLRAIENYPGVVDASVLRDLIAVTPRFDNIS